VRDRDYEALASDCGYHERVRPTRDAHLPDVELLRSANVEWRTLWKSVELVELPGDRASEFTTAARLARVVPGHGGKKLVPGFGVEAVSHGSVADDRCEAPLDFLRGDDLGLAALDLFEPPRKLLPPRFVDLFLRLAWDAIDDHVGEPALVFLREGFELLEDLLGGVGHAEDRTSLDVAMPVAR